MTDAPIAPEGVLETALYASDPEACAQFYAQVVGLQEHQRVEGRHVFLRCGKGMLMLFKPDATEAGGSARLPVPPHGARGAGHVCFRVQDGSIAEWAKRLQDLEIEIEADFEWPNGVRSIYVRDPAQNSVEFAEAALWKDAT
ncbi:MAG: VOC family protein [Sulfitobacter sp.]